MISLGERKTLRLGVMSALYVAQGIPYGFVTVTLAAWVASRGASEGQVGDLAAFSMLPWAFKWLWAPLVDRFSHAHMGRRRPWILLAQGLLVVGAGLLALAPSDDLGLLGWLVFDISNSARTVALVGFALFAGQGESENRAINSTVAAVLAFTAGVAMLTAAIARMMMRLNSDSRKKLPVAWQYTGMSARKTSTAPTAMLRTLTSAFIAAAPGKAPQGARSAQLPSAGRSASTTPKVRQPMQLQGS